MFPTRKSRVTKENRDLFAAFRRSIVGVESKSESPEKEISEVELEKLSKKEADVCKRPLLQKDLTISSGIG